MDCWWHGPPPPWLRHWCFTIVTDNGGIELIRTSSKKRVIDFMKFTFPIQLNLIKSFASLRSA